MPKVRYSLKKKRRKKSQKKGHLHPMILIWEMARFLLTGAFSHKLLGMPVDDTSWAQANLNFWEKAKCIIPSHDVYERHRNHLTHCIPCILHGDEGVGHRRRPVLHLSWGPLLSVGMGAVHRLFLITSCPHKLYSKLNSGSGAGNLVIDRLLEECGRSASRAYHQGIETDQGTFYLVFLGACGDHPWHTKSFRCVRGHLCKDICHHCMGNLSSIPFEDLSDGALWRMTIFQTTPWQRSPPLALVHGADHPSFIKNDFMHTFPHGCARNYCASIICMMAGPLDLFQPSLELEGRDKPLRLHEAYSHFWSWCHCTSSFPRDLQDFTKENLGWINNHDFPDMSCKASDTNLLIRWLLDLLSTIPYAREESLEIAYSGLRGLDDFSRLAYTGDRVFWDSAKQERGLTAVAAFLHSYQRLAHLWLTRGWTFFNMVPKVHYAAHFHEELREARRLTQPFTFSPGLFATPIMEDFIGLTSRMSRTVHPSSVPLGTLRKYLVLLRKEWTKKLPAQPTR